jgi:hypothetical protein
MKGTCPKSAEKRQTKHEKEMGRRKAKVRFGHIKSGASSFVHP